jgi:lactobin A/cerein 7B family class IIb bacteriocin
MIRELTINEMEEVSGGVLPLVAAAVSVAQMTAARTAATYVVSRGMAVYAVYSAASAY